jgi:hypothetical protein
VVDIGSIHRNQPYTRLRASSNLEVPRKYWLGVRAFVVCLKIASQSEEIELEVLLLNDYVGELASVVSVK